MIEECLDFHARHPTDRELRLLYFSLAPEIADQAIVQWAFARLYPFPSAPGIHTWPSSRGGAITCKGALDLLERIRSRLSGCRRCRIRLASRREA